jgi:hypothetical protein
MKKTLFNNSKPINNKRSSVTEKFRKFIDKIVELFEDFIELFKKPPTMVCMRANLLNFVLLFLVITLIMLSLTVSYKVNNPGSDDWKMNLFADENYYTSTKQTTTTKKSLVKLVSYYNQ